MRRARARFFAGSALCAGVLLSAQAAPAPPDPQRDLRPELLPELLAFPYRVAGSGGEVATVSFRWNHTEDVRWRVDPPPSSNAPAPFRIESAPERLTPSARAEVTVQWTGADVERIDTATLVAETDSGTYTMPIVAVAGDPAIPAGAWQDVPGPEGSLHGRALTLALPTAPFPDKDSPWTDASVRIFVPEDYRERGQQALIVHFHGWNQSIVETLNTHHYEDHVWASGTNAILVIPQGPDHANSGTFGKLMRPGGLDALTREVLVVLYRDLGLAPVLGELVLTSHSGGYQAVAAGLNAGNPPVSQVGLFDSLYGMNDAFVAWTLAGGRLRSLWTDHGGTASANRQVDSALQRDGVPLSHTATERSYRDAAAVIAQTPADHDGTTRLDAAYSEQLRWGLRQTRLGPRVDLRSVLPMSGSGGGPAGGSGGPDLLVRWFSPPDDDLTGFEVQTSASGGAWTTVATLPPSASSAQVHPGGKPAGGWNVRVRPVVRGVPEPIVSDGYHVDANATVLIIDAMDRLVQGAQPRLSDDLAARVGESLGGRPAVATASKRAISEDNLNLKPYGTILWLAGDSRPEDAPLPASARTVLRQFIDHGGKLIVSGQAVAEQLNRDDPAFLAEVLGAQFVGGAPANPGHRATRNSRAVPASPAILGTLDLATGGVLRAPEVLGKPGHAALIPVALDRLKPETSAERVRQAIALTVEAPSR